MLNELDYTIEEGESSPYDICVYALSTCGFCKKGINFLREKKVKFRYIYVDLIGQDLRLRTKKELSDKYNERIGFPFVVITSFSLLSTYGVLKTLMVDVFPSL